MRRRSKTVDPATQSNPWGFTEKEAEIFDAMIQFGCGKRVAQRLGVSLKTVEGHCTRGGSKMGDDTRLMRYIKWDRFRRGEKV